MDYSKMKNSNVLITGATGMIGQNTVKYIERLNRSQDLNIHIIAHGRNNDKVKKLMTYSNIVPLVCDISDLSYDGSVDYIIHTASITGGSKQHVDYPMYTINTSISGAKRVLDLALSKQCKGIVFLSSLEIYGNTGSSNRLIKEDDSGYIDTMNPRSSYSEGKRICECMFAAYAKQYQVPAMVARLTASFGEGVSPNDNRVFAQFAHSIIEHKDIILKSTGETVRNYCDALDVASALIAILLFGKPGQAYNVANMSAEISIRDLAQRFIDLYPDSNSKLVFDLNDDFAKHGYNPVMRNVLDSSKLMNLGWKPEYGINDMICHLVDSLLDQL